MLGSVSSKGTRSGSVCQEQRAQNVRDVGTTHHSSGLSQITLLSASGAVVLWKYNHFQLQLLLPADLRTHQSGCMEQCKSAVMRV